MSCGSWFRWSRGTSRDRQRPSAHYRITAALGAGGMGEVWRATDTKLGREVALKVLPAEMAENPERLDRFRREATMLAALDHPGVVGVYSVEESDGLHFLTMQLVEGRTAGPADPGGWDGRRSDPRDRRRHRRSAGGRPRQGHHPPRSQTGQRHGRLRWAGQGLDFGLAKIAGPQADEPLNSEMATDLHTRDGVVMGTVP